MRPTTLLFALLAAMASAVSSFAEEPGFTTTHVNLRTGPGTDFSSLGVLSGGTALTVYSCRDGWCAVDLGRAQGFIAQEYVGLARPNRRADRRHDQNRRRAERLNRAQRQDLRRRQQAERRQQRIDRRNLRYDGRIRRYSSDRPAPIYRDSEESRRQNRFRQPTVQQPLVQDSLARQRNRRYDGTAQHRNWRGNRQRYNDWHGNVQRHDNRRANVRRQQALPGEPRRPNRQQRQLRDAPQDTRANHVNRRNTPRADRRQRSQHDKARQQALIEHQREQQRHLLQPDLERIPGFEIQFNRK